jgi:uncharacterized iron-regulated membrane protein
LRKAFFWMHLVAGVLVGALIIFFSVTGALLAYERPILQAVGRSAWRAADHPAGAVPVPLEELVDHAAASLAAPVTAVTIHQDAHMPVELETADHGVYFADAWSGSVQGPVAPRLRGFFSQVTSLHRWFGLSNAHHATAIAIKGAAVLLLLFQLGSGAVLWLPHRWNGRALRNSVTYRLGGSNRARNYNWHKVTGFWTALPLGMVVITGVIMAYPWANALLFRVAGSPVPVREGNRQPRGHEHGAPRQLRQAFAQATSTVTDWQTATLRLPAGASGLAFVVDSGDGGHPDKREQVVVDGKTLAVKRREPFAAMSRGQRWRSWVRFTHTGEAGGWWGETLALIAALAAIVLSVTGYALSLNRLRRYRRVAAEEVTHARAA